MIRTQHQILRNKKLRSTQSRSTILQLFLTRDHALSYADIEEEIALTIDRVTVYRTLKTFLERGMIHKVLDDKGSVKYAMCNDHCSTDDHHHNHVHFKCQVCEQTSCLEDVKIPRVNLPDTFKIRDINLLVQGICNRCN